MPVAPAPLRFAVGLVPTGAHDTGAPTSLRDRSLEPRAGVKGPGAPAFLAAHGIVTDGIANRAARHPAGGLVAMLSGTEVLILGAAAAPFADYGSGAPLAPGVYPVPRFGGTYWFSLAGPGAPALLATLCGVDLRPHRFADLAIAQTMIARVSAVIVRDDADGLGFHIVGDITLAPYVADALRKAEGP
ncbi:MAG: hypothetical protein FJX67_14785 [Alphaproteobacteria bacterium]|nr:hypothetical protein [Alphaproteobacteria bacterium]